MSDNIKYPLLLKPVVKDYLWGGTRLKTEFGFETDKEIAALISAYREIAPRSVMLYSIDRATPEQHLEKVGKDELERIAEQIRAAGIQVQVNA